MDSKFDFIPAIDRDNIDKREELFRRIDNNEPNAIAFERSHPAALGAVITRFDNFGKTITVDQCKSIADELSVASGSSNIYSIQISLGADKTAVYFVKHNCLRIFVSGDPVYENDNGRICRDRYALSDSGTSRMWY